MQIRVNIIVGGRKKISEFSFMGFNIHVYSCHGTNLKILPKITRLTRVHLPRFQNWLMTVQHTNYHKGRQIAKETPSIFSWLH